MSDPVVRIEPTRVAIEPGSQARVNVTVRSTGRIVEGYRLTVGGEPAAWAEIVIPSEPGDADQADVLQVYPGQEAAALVVFTAPAGTAGTAGGSPFCVLATSLVDAGSSAAAEGDIELAQVPGLSGSVVPVTSTGRWSGRHAVTLRNWGNAPAAVVLDASDPDQLLGFLLHPSRLDLPVGGSATVALRVRARRPFLRGAPVRAPFTVAVQPALPGPVAGPALPDPSRPVLDGVFAQRPVLSTGTVAIGALVVAALVAATVIALTYRADPQEQLPVDASVSAPLNLVATAVDSGSIRLQWDAVEREPDEHLVFLVDPLTVDQRLPVTQAELSAPGTVTQFVAQDLAPGTDHCFEMAAVLGDVQSPRTEHTCTATPAAAVVPPTVTSSAVDTPVPTSSATPTRTTTGPDPATPTTAVPTPTTTTATTTTPPPSANDVGPTDWVLGFPFPQDPGSGVLKEDRRQELVAAGHEVGELDSADYPELRFARPTDLLFVGRFASEADARAFCTGRQELTDCDPFLPGPKR